MMRIVIGVLLLGSACSSGGSGGGAGAAASAVVVNELLPHGGTTDDPDWAELKNLSDSSIDLSGYAVRDKELGHLFTLPRGTSIPAGGYLVIYCDDQPDGGAADVLHAPWKLSASTGDEFHLLDPRGTELDQATFGAGVVPGGRSWGRLPDGTGAFLATTPSRGASNL
jgi:hypothetical protein